MMQRIDGRAVADRILTTTKDLVATLSRAPRLGVLLVGDYEPSHRYVALKEKAATQVGIVVEKAVFPAQTPGATILAAIDSFNAREDIDAILLQLPLPPHLDIDRDMFVQRVNPSKDVDGFHPVNIAKFMADEPVHTPVLVQAVMTLIEETGVATQGLNGAILGKSDVFTKPLAHGLERLGIVVERLGTDPGAAKEVLLQADVVVTALGKPWVIKKEHLKPGAIVIDIGQTVVNGVPYGDVDIVSAKEVAGFLTPVPGGVGPVTVANLMATTAAFCQCSLAK